MPENVPTDSLDVLAHGELNPLDTVMARNLRLLERAYIPNTPPLTNFEEEEAHFSLSAGERRVEGENTLLSSIHIYYETKTGRIIKRPNFDSQGQLRDGDVSILRTYLISDGEKIDYNKKAQRWNTTAGTYKILLAYPDGWLNPHALQAAVNEQYGNGDGASIER